MKKRVVQALGCILAMTMVVGSLTACGGKSEKKAEKKAGSDVKVAIICSAAGQNDNGYNQSAVEGAKKAADEFGIEYKVVEPTTGVPQALESLADDGYKEIILTAQDTTRYGQDIYGTPKLVQLLKEIEKIDKIKWIRILYSYPETITDELIKTVKESSKICHYFDIPIQHISDSVLKRMNRKSNGESIRKLIIKLRKEIPDVIIRTTVMVGFPGETQEDFEELYEFLKEAKFDKLGAFTYSKEEGTAAEKMPNQVHPSTKRNRYNKVMKLQQEISKKNLENKIETIQKVRIEGMTNNKKYYVGRSYMDVPEIDGLIYIENTKALNLGEWINCKIIGIKEYDMIGKIN